MIEELREREIKKELKRFSHEVAMSMTAVAVATRGGQNEKHVYIYNQQHWRKLHQFQHQMVVAFTCPHK